MLQNVTLKYYTSVLECSFTPINVTLNKIEKKNADLFITWIPLHV